MDESHMDTGTWFERQTLDMQDIIINSHLYNWEVQSYEPCLKNSLMQSENN